MVNRSAYDEMIEKMGKVYSHHKGFSFESSLTQIKTLRDNFDIKLMLVGHFSAGKSSLLNMLVERPDFLKEAQEPQTAIATELVYDEEEKAYAYDTAGNKNEIIFGQECSVQDYDHLEYRICSENLKKIGDFTIVDTPGFDAGIEAHAKALANYIGIGSAYLVVVDQEKGGIDETTLEFIQEISNYSKQIAILINKCDKITSEVAESIADSARFTLATHGLNYKVYTVSKRDENIADKLIEIISEFNAQAAFDKEMIKKLVAELVNAEKILSVVQKKIYLDTFDLDADIATYTRLEEQLANTFETKKEEAKEDLDNTVKEVTERVRGILISKAESVVEALLSGNQVAAEAIILETVRPIMLSTMKDISIRQIDNVTDSLDFSGLVNEGEGVDLSSIAVNIANNIKDMIVEGTFETKGIENNTKNKKNQTIYHVITGIAAIATDIIAPWLEVIIILLPDVVNLLRGMFGETDAELAKRRYINNVVPQIMNKMYPQIKHNVEETTKMVLDEYEKLLTEKLEGIKTNIKDAHQKKEEKIQEYEQYKEYISNDIVVIKNMINELG